MILRRGADDCKAARGIATRFIARVHLATAVVCSTAIVAVGAAEAAAAHGGSAHSVEGFSPLAAVRSPVPGGSSYPGAGARIASGYGWPLKPFHVPHPLRAHFGDPRWPFVRQGTPKGKPSFHFGVDVPGHDGARVYATATGWIGTTRSHVTIRSASGTFTYWHIVPAVRAGQWAVAYRTVIGRIREGHGHLHLGESQGGEYLNPLRSGALGPYRDQGPPVVEGLLIRRAGVTVDPAAVSGEVALIADAWDGTTISRGPWADGRLTPAVVRWKLLRAGRVVVPWRTAFDVRLRRPPQHAFSSVYARGTIKNWRSRPGRYLFYLRRHLDTSRLRRGDYTAVVTAGDMRGNVALRRFPFTIQPAGRP